MSPPPLCKPNRRVTDGANTLVGTEGFARARRAPTSTGSAGAPRNFHRIGPPAISEIHVSAPPAGSGNTQHHCTRRCLFPLAREVMLRGAGATPANREPLPWNPGAEQPDPRPKLRGNDGVGCAIGRIQVQILHTIRRPRHCVIDYQLQLFGPASG